MVLFLVLLLRGKRGAERAGEEVMLLMKMMMMMILLMRDVSSPKKI